MLEKTASSVHVINLDLVAFESNGDHVFERHRNTLHVLLITQWSAISTASTGLRMNSLGVLKYQFNYSMYNMILPRLPFYSPAYFLRCFTVRRSTIICESATWWAAWCSFKIKSTTWTRGFLLVLDRSWQHLTILCQKNCWGFSVTVNSPRASEKVFIHRHRTLKLSRRLISSSTRRHSRDSTMCICCAL